MSRRTQADDSYADGIYAGDIYADDIYADDIYADERGIVPKSILRSLRTAVLDDR